MSEWKEYKLGDIIEAFIDYRGKTPQKSSSGIPLITAKVVKNGKILPPNEFIPDADYDSWMTRGLPEINDVVLTTEAPLGEVALIKDNKVALAQRIITMRGKRDIVDNVFLKYYFQSKQGQYELSSRASGTTVFGIKAEVLRKVPISLPALDEQHRIASILSSLDDKIDLLHRENVILEQMAETLFRQWFVEEAKEEWEEKPLTSFIKVIGGGTPKTSEATYWNGNICWLSGGDIASNHKSFVSSSEKSISENGLNNSSAKLLPENAMVVSARGTVGKYCLLSKPMTFSQSNYGIIPVYNNCYFFTYLLVAYHIDELQSAAYGSVFDTITTKTFEGVGVLLPKGTGYIAEFEKIIEPYFSKMKYNHKQIQTLIQTRDGLLPRLMGRELKV